MSAPRFCNGDAVLLRATLDMGRIDGEPQRIMGEWIYKVRFARQVNKVAENDLDVVAESEGIADIVRRGKWGMTRSFRVAMAVAKIENENPNTVYAFRAQKILFEPFQYKPLLKFLESPDRRLLIADEVGLGKTVEAGLILAELEARRSKLERVLVVCPSRLRDKWHDEMSRKFDRDFVKATRDDFVQYLESNRKKSGGVPFRFIASMQTLRNEELGERLLAEMPTLDLLIVDEAHHARNPASRTSRIIRELCARSDAAIFLTATPVHLGTDDLFHLLDALRPGGFGTAEVFQADLERHAPLHRAGQLVRTQTPEALVEVAEVLRRLFIEGVAASQRHPLATQVLESLADSPEDRRAWIELERRIQELHPLSSILTRTRKRDVIPNAPVREPHVLRCQWTADEEAAYLAWVGDSGKSGWNRGSMSIEQVTRARQAASCLPAALEGWSPILDDDDAAERIDLLPSELGWLKSDSAKTLPRVDVPKVDSKFRKFVELLQTIEAEEPGAKVLVFTYFLGTSRYLNSRLAAVGIAAERIAGDVPSHAKDPTLDVRGQAMLRFREDPTLRVLVSTEVGSEGLDFQFCHYLVNYDLPWNPMVVEQRIGRIDRFGQKHAKLNIFNIVVEGSVEDRILARLYERIDIFRRSIGPLESILGETVEALLKDWVGGELTPEQQSERIERHANAIVAKRIELEQLERNAANLLGHEEYINDQLGRVKRLGRYLTERSLLGVIESFLAVRHPTVKVVPRGYGMYWMRVTDALRRDIQSASAPGRVWVDHSREGDFHFCFDGEIAYRSAAAELVNVSHPLVRAAAAAVKQQLENPHARVARGVVTLKQDDDRIDAGQYLLLVFLQDIKSVRSRVVPDPICWSFATEAIMPIEVGERLLHLVLDEADEWDSNSVPSTVTEEILEKIQIEALVRRKRLDLAEKSENAAQISRRKALIEAEIRRRLASIDQGIRTATERGHEKIVPLWRAQRQKAEAELHRRIADLAAAGEPRCLLVDDPVAACLALVRR